MASAPPPTSGDVHRLELLPEELIDHILSFLTPWMPEINETRPVGGYIKLLPEEPWYEPTRCRAALRASCLVSKRIRAIAEQYQYHNVALLSDRQLICFLRTLATRHEDIGKWNRYFAVHLTLNDTEVYSRIAERFRSLPAETWKASTNDTLKSLVMFRRDKGKGDNEWLRAVPECLVLAMLSVLHKAETFMLQIPVCETEEPHQQPQYTTLLETFHYAKISVGKSLRKLLIQTDPEVLSMIHEDIETHGDPGMTAGSAGVYWPILIHCPNITTLEVSHDDGNWCTSAQLPSAFCLTQGDCPRHLQRLKHVFLNDSYSTAQTIADLLAHMPELETLCVDPKWSEDNEAAMDTPVVRTLDESLLAYGQKLRRLDLGFWDCSQAMDSIGEDGYLTCLPQLPSLDQLHVQLGLLFPKAPEVASSISATDSNTTTSRPSIDSASISSAPFPSLSQRLPPNVNELTLEDWWWRPLSPRVDRRIAPAGADELLRHWRYYHSPYNVSHRRAVVAGLVRFALEVRAGAMPKLRKVLFVVRTSEQWTFPGQHWNKKRQTTALSLTAEETELLREVERRTPAILGWNETSRRWWSLESMFEEQAYKMADFDRHFCGLKEMVAEVESQAGAAGEVKFSDKWERLTQRIQMRDAAQQSEGSGSGGQVAMEPLTLREHLAEVEGMFLRQGIQFEVSEM